MSAPFTIYRATGTIDPGNRVEGVTADGVPWIEVDATLFYEGRHRPGDPNWSAEDLDAMDAQFQAPTGDLDWSVPIQLDHSESARDTQGHLRKTWREKVLVDGEQREGLKGRLRYVGEEAVEKVKSGLWRKLSLAIYTASKIIREVTVTPFPCLAGATNHTESEEDPMAAKAKEKEAPAAETQPEPETKPTPEPEPAPVAQFSGSTIEELRSEFLSYAAKQQEEMNALKRENREQGKIIRFNELTKEVKAFSEAGKTLPCMASAELALLETFTPDQMKLFRAYKEATPNLVELDVKGSQDAEEVDEFKNSLTKVDPSAEGQRLSNYFQSSRKEVTK